MTNDNYESDTKNENKYDSDIKNEKIDKPDEMRESVESYYRRRYPGAAPFNLCGPEQNQLVPATQEATMYEGDETPSREELTLLNEEWSVGKTIGQGQFGTVYHAYSSKGRGGGSNGNHAAAKIYHGHSTSSNLFDAESVFEAEKEALSSIDHPRVLGIIDSFKVPDPYDREQKKPVIVADYVPGPTLEHVIRAREPMEEDRASLLVSRIGEGIAYMQERQGIAHKDLGPQNVKIKEGDEPVILDFGMARHITEELQTQFIRSRIVGKEFRQYYVPPEVDAGISTLNTDLYSLSMIWRDLLLGRFGGLTLKDHELRGINPDARELIQRNLSLEYKHRSPDAKTFLEGLERILGNPIRAQTLVRKRQDFIMRDESLNKLRFSSLDELTGLKKGDRVIFLGMSQDDEFDMTSRFLESEMEVGQEYLVLEVPDSDLNTHLTIEDGKGESVGFGCSYFGNYLLAREPTREVAEVGEDGENLPSEYSIRDNGDGTWILRMPKPSRGNDTASILRQFDEGKDVHETIKNLRDKIANQFGYSQSVLPEGSKMPDYLEAESQLTRVCLQYLAQENPTNSALSELASGKNPEQLYEEVKAGKPSRLQHGTNLFFRHPDLARFEYKQARKEYDEKVGQLEEIASGVKGALGGIFDRYPYGLFVGFWVGGGLGIATAAYLFGNPGGIYDLLVPAGGIFGAVAGSNFQRYLERRKLLEKITEMDSWNLTPESPKKLEDRVGEGDVGDKLIEGGGEE